MPRFGYSAETYDDALVKFMYEYTTRIMEILQCLGVDIYVPNNISQINENTFGYGFFKVVFTSIIPNKITCLPLIQKVADVKISSPIIKVYRNNSKKIKPYLHKNKTGSGRKNIKLKESLVGLDVIDESVHIKDEVFSDVLFVKTKSKNEYILLDRINKTKSEINVKPKRQVRVTEAKWSTRAKETSEFQINFKFSFDVYGHIDWFSNQHHGVNFKDSKDWKKEFNSSDISCRFLSCESLRDFHDILKGVSPRFPNMNFNLLQVRRVCELFREMIEHALFVKTKESNFDFTHYSSPIISEEGLK